MRFTRSDLFQKTVSWRLLSVIALVMLADQLSKWVMLDLVGMASRAPIQVTEFFALVMVWNYGVSFGMLAMPETVMPLLLIALAILISMALWVTAHRETSPTERYCYAVIIGGALGNVIDRWRFGAVADFFYLHIGDYGWPAFNIADSAIFCGVALLLIRLLLKK